MMVEVSMIIRNAWNFDHKKMIKRYLAVVLVSLLVILFWKWVFYIRKASSSPINVNIASVGTETPIIKSSYIVGLAYHELGDKNVTINVPVTIPQNTTLVITLYEAYQTGFRQQYDANVNIVGLGKNHVKTIIWATLENTLHFTTDARTKRLPYAGYKESSVNQVAQKEFGRNADVILSAYRSPQIINIASVGTEAPTTKPSYIVGLAYYVLGDKSVKLNMSATIPQNSFSNNTL